MLQVNSWRAIIQLTSFLRMFQVSGDCHLMLYADDILLFKPINTNAELEDFQGKLDTKTRSHP